MDKRTVIVGVIVGASVPIVEALVQFDPMVIADWRTWIVGIAAASVRQGAVQILPWLLTRKPA